MNKLNEIANIIIKQELDRARDTIIKRISDLLSIRGEDHE